MFIQKLFNMKNLLFILITLIMVSCGSSSVEAVDNVADGVVDTASVDTVSADVGGVSGINPKYKIAEGLEGSSFLHLFLTQKSVGDFNGMIDFTHSESIQKFGKEELISMYRENFTNVDTKTLDLKSMKTIDANTYEMFYTINEFATKRAVSITVKVENDTCKLLITEPLNKRLL
jgi:hypothetical protein